MAALLVGERGAAGQVNIEPIRHSLLLRRHVLDLEVAILGRTGNSEGIDSSLALGVGLRSEGHLAFFQGSAEFGRFNGTVSVEKAFAHVRYNYELSPWVNAEVFEQVQSDVLQRLRLRQLVGFGPRFRLVEDERVRVALGSAYMYEYDAFNVARGAPDAPSRVAHRSSNYLSLYLPFDPGISLLVTTYYQPRFDQFADYRVLSETLLEYRLTTLFSLKLSFQLRYDSVPAGAVRPLDTELKNTFSLKL